MAAAPKMITKKTAAGFATMLSQVGVLTVEQLAELAAATTAQLQEKLQSGGPMPAKKAAAKKVAAAASAEEDEEEAEAASKVPPHLAYNQVWARFVGLYVRAHGWDKFSKKVTVRGTKDSYMQEMPASIQNEAGQHVFPNTGKPISPAEVLSLAKLLKDTEDAIWLAHVAENPLPATVPKAKKVLPVKAAAAAVTVVPPAVMPRKLPAVAAAAAAAAPVAAPLKIAKVNKQVVKPVESEWVCPEAGEGFWFMDGIQYIRDVEDLVWTLKVNADGDAQRDVWCGKWDKVTKLFDKTVADPRDALENDA